MFSAPGRVNLIGEHTDYTGGLVLPFAIDARANLAAARNDDNVIRVTSAQRPGAVTTVALQGLGPDSAVAAEWAGYLVGAIWALREAGYPIGGFDLALDSQVPSGAGLSSSAAVECVTTLAAASLSGIELDAMEIARFAQQAENDFVGVPCGPMDQTASAASEQGSVLLFDTRAHTVENIPFDPANENLAVLVIDTRVAHSLADGEYGRRRASCEQAAKILGVQWLRDVGIDDLPNALAQLDSDELRRRVRHVVTENDRVTSTVELLRQWPVDRDRRPADRIASFAPRRLRGVLRGTGSGRRGCPGRRSARRPDDRRRIRRLGHRVAPDRGGRHRHRGGSCRFRRGRVHRSRYPDWSDLPRARAGSPER